MAHPETGVLVTLDTPANRKISHLISLDSHSFTPFRSCGDTDKNGGMSGSVSWIPRASRRLYVLTIGRYPCTAQSARVTPGIMISASGTVTHPQSVTTLSSFRATMFSIARLERCLGDVPRDALFRVLVLVLGGAEAPGAEKADAESQGGVTHW